MGKEQVLPPHSTLLLLALCGTVGPLCGAPVPITALAFSPDGRALVANGDRGIDVRSSVDAAMQRHLPCDLARVTRVAFLPGGDRLMVGGGEPGVRGEVRVLTWPEGRELQRFEGFADVVSDIAARADTNGVRLAAASADHSARVWRLANGSADAPVQTIALTGHAGPVLAIAFSAAGRSIVTGSADRSVKVWSVDDGRLLRSLSHHTEAVQALAFRPGPDEGSGTGRGSGSGSESPAVCATGADDRTVRVWQPEIGRMVRIVRRHEGAVLALAWSKDGSALYSAGREGVIRRIAADSDAIEHQWRAHDDWIYALAVSPDGARLASGDWSGTVRLHSLR